MADPTTLNPGTNETFNPLLRSDYGPDDGACTYIGLEQTNQETIILSPDPSGCLEMLHYVCEHTSLSWSAFDISLSDILSTSMDKLTVHSTMSVTACMGICGDKDFAILNDHCICLSNKNYETGLTAVQYCDITVPCPGNILQHCGCIQDMNDIANVLPIFYSSGPGGLPGDTTCETLRLNGVYVNSDYLLADGTTLTCNHQWETSCPSGWFLFGEMCAFLHSNTKAFDSIVCPHGDFLESVTLGYFLESTGQITDANQVWGKKDSSDCFSSKGNPEDCSTQLRFVCSIKLCPPDYHLRAGECLSLSDSSSAVFGSTESHTTPNAVMAGLIRNLMLTVDGFGSGQNLISSRFTLNSQELCWGQDQQDLVDCTAAKLDVIALPVPCPPGTLMHPNNQACLLVQDLIEQTDQTISDIASMCEERNMHLPAFTTVEEANDFAANLTNILKPYVNVTQMTIPLGVTSIEDIGLLWQSGRYQFYPEETFDIDALSANNVNANGQPGLLVPLNGSHAFFMQEKRFSTRFLICERPWMSAFCIEKDSLGDPTLSDALTSLDNCRQYCQNTGHEFSNVWEDNCQCQSTNSVVDLFIEENQTPGMCSVQCSDSYCGQSSEQSVLSVVNHAFPSPAKTCEDLNLKRTSFDTSYSFPFGFVTFEDSGNSTMVACHYENTSICQESLMDKAIVKEQGDKVEINFNEIVVIRYIHAAWDVTDVKISETIDTQEATDVTMKDDTTVWTASLPEEMTKALPYPKLGQYLSFTMDSTLDKLQGSSYPDMAIRGCKINNNPPLTQAEPVVTLLKPGLRLSMINGTDNAIKSFEEANAICNPGFLVVPDSQEKMDILLTLIEEYVNKITEPDVSLSAPVLYPAAAVSASAPALYLAPAPASGSNESDIIETSFLIGLRRDTTSKEWIYSNGKPFGYFDNFDTRYPSVDNDCVGMTVATNVSDPEVSMDDLTWNIIPCNDFEDVHPICELRSEPLQQTDLNPSFECYIVDQRQGWNEIHFSGSNIDENDCREGCSDITKNWQWFILDRGSCYCLEHLTTGFWPLHECFNKVEGTDKVTVQPLWSLGCAPLQDLPTKNLILRDHNPLFQVGTSATYECSIGHHISAYGNSSFILNCQPDGSWSMDLSILPACEPIRCQQPLLQAPQGFDWSMEQNIFVTAFLMDSSLTIKCPEEKYFYEDSVNVVTAFCGNDSKWHASHSVGCQGYSIGTELNDTEEACSEIALDSMPCMYPPCKHADINDSNGIDVNDSMANPIGYDMDNRVSSTVTFQCDSSAKAFRMPDDIARSNLTYTCTYNSDTESSSWITTYNGADMDTLPTCEAYCPHSPENGTELMERSWDGNPWGDSVLEYTCDPNMAFNLVNASKGDTINPRCTSDNDTHGEPNWLFEWPFYESGNLSLTLPKCDYICEDPPYDPESHNRTWTDGLRGVGAKASYTCSNESLIFRSRQVYRNIEMACSKVNGSTEAIWIWTDEGNERQDLPDCETGPVCLSIQEQMDSSKDFNPDFVVDSFGSYLQPLEGLYTNETAPTGARVNLSCYYEGESMSIGDGEASSIILGCYFNPDTVETYWNWTDPANDTLTISDRLPFCLEKCTTFPPSRSDLKRSWNKLLWIGENATYQCKDGSELVKRNSTHGSKYVISECKVFGEFDPWWQPNIFPQCETNLIEIPMDEVLQGKHEFYSRAAEVCEANRGQARCVYLFRTSSWTSAFEFGQVPGACASIDAPHLPSVAFGDLGRSAS